MRNVISGSWGMINGFFAFKYAPNMPLVHKIAAYVKKEDENKQLINSANYAVQLIDQSFRLFVFFFTTIMAMKSGESPHQEIQIGLFSLLCCVLSAYNLRKNYVRAVSVNDTTPFLSARASVVKEEEKEDSPQVSLR